MAYTVYKNAQFGSFVFQSNATQTLVVAGNSSVSNVALPNEVVTGASVFAVTWGVANGGSWTVSRGANVILTLVGSGALSPQLCELVLDTQQSGNVTVTLAGGTGNIIVGLRKYGNNFNQSY